MSDLSARAVVDQCIIRQSLHILRFTLGLDPSESRKDYDQQTIEEIQRYFERLRPLVHKITTEDRPLYESLLNTAHGQGLFAKPSKISDNVSNNTKDEPKDDNDQASHFPVSGSNQTSSTSLVSNTETNPLKRKSEDGTGPIGLPSGKKVKCDSEERNDLGFQHSEASKGKAPTVNSNEDTNVDKVEASSDSEENASNNGYTSQPATPSEKLKAILEEESQRREDYNIGKTNLLKNLCACYVSELRELSNRKLRMILQPAESFIKHKYFRKQARAPAIQSLSERYFWQAKTIHSRIHAHLVHISSLLNDRESFDRVIDREFRALNELYSAFLQEDLLSGVQSDKAKDYIRRQQMIFEQLEDDWEHRRRLARFRYAVQAGQEEGRAREEEMCRTKARDEKIKALREMSEGGEATPSSSSGAASPPK